MKKINILLNGCNGNMGKEIVNATRNSKSFNIISGFDKENLNLYTFPVYTNFDSIFENPDVIIDFSVPSASIKVLNFAKRKRIPIVIATTGFSDDEYNKIIECSKQIPIFQSYNMSFNIFLMQKIVKFISPYLQHTDIEIVDSHHNKKIDAPSGTALMLANSINEACNKKYYYNLHRVSTPKKRKKNEIGFSSIRGGNIVGEHTVKFISDNDTLEIKHISYSRQIFVEGAFRAAKFLINKPSGLYHMDDLDC